MLGNQRFWEQLLVGEPDNRLTPRLARLAVWLRHAGFDCPNRQKDRQIIPQTLVVMLQNPLQMCHSAGTTIGTNIGKIVTIEATAKTLFDHPSDMEPLLADGSEDLSRLALQVIRGAERLRGSLHPITRALIADLVRSMNSYYSNLIEGHRARPRDIEAAIRKEFSKSPAQRSLQIQHIAHMESQAEMEARLPEMAAGEICSADFLCWLHQQFYDRLPKELLAAEDEKGKVHEVPPGKIRQSEVSVGRHMAPASKKLGDFLKRFAEFYGPLVTTETQSLNAPVIDGSME